MSRMDGRSKNVLGRRVRAQREALGWSQEKLGVLIGIDESSSRARISRYELGVHEPPSATARLIADALGVPVAFLYCEDDDVAILLHSLHQLQPTQQSERAREFLGILQQAIHKPSRSN